MQTMRAVDISDLIDERPIGRLQMTTFFLCALVAFLDGVDSQSIGVAAPFIAKALQLQKAELGIMFSAATIGGMLAAMMLGTLADRFGRKRMLIAATAIFGIGTLATAMATTLTSLLAWRVITGIGLGGAAPCFIALASEYAPKRRRATITSLLWAAFPLGGMSGGFINAIVIRHFDWHMIFAVGGILPLLLALTLAAWLPESPRFLTTQPSQKKALETIAERLGVPVGQPITVAIRGPEGVPLRELFDTRRRGQTVLLSLMFFMSFATLAIAVTWMPVLLREEGLGAADVGVVVGFHGLGALIGMASVGRLIERFGPAWTLLPALCAGAIATAATGQTGTSVVGASVAVAMIGLFVGIGGSGAIALAVLIYPAHMRSTGVGWCMGMARLGQVIAPIVLGQLAQVGLTTSHLLLYVGLAPVIAAMSVAAMGCARLLPARAGIGSVAPIGH